MQFSIAICHDVGDLTKSLHTNTNDPEGDEFDHHARLNSTGQHNDIMGDVRQAMAHISR